MSIQNQLANSNHILKFTRPGMNDFEIQLQQYEIPSISLAQAAAGAPKIGGFQIIGTAMTFEPFVVTALLDEDLLGWLTMYKWCKELVEPKAGNPVKFNDSVAQASLHILTNNKAARKLIVEFKNIWPTELTGFNFSSVDTDDVPPLTYTVTFKYEVYSISNDGVMS